MSAPNASKPQPSLSTNSPDSTTAPSFRPTGNPLSYDSDSDGQARGGRRKQQLMVPLPTSTGLAAPAGQMLKGATDEHGKPRDAALLLGIKLDLEAEVHLTARVKGDVCVGLY